MGRVLKLASVKAAIRERDLQEEDQEGGVRTQDDRIFGKDKDVAQLDPFFVEAQDEEAVAKTKSGAFEKRAVMRDGRVPKFQKTIAKEQEKEIERQAKREGWLQQQEDEKREV